MGLTLELLEEPDDYWLDDPEQDAEYRRWQSRQRAHCLCGRFARFLRVEHYYNGTWNCARTWIHCSRCGEVKIEHV